MMKAQALPRDVPPHFQARLSAWRGRSLSTRAAAVLALAGCDTAEDVAALGRSHFEGLSNCAQKTLQELADVAGWPAKTPRDAIASALRLSLPDPEDALEAAGDVMCALQRNRFAIVAARQSEPAGRRHAAE